MTNTFKDQGGAATMDPSAIRRWLTSKLMTRMANMQAQHRRRAKAERTRNRNGERHRIEYFHQVDDPYSHLAAQLLQPLRDHYDVDLVCHLVDVSRDGNLPEPELLAQLGRHEAAVVAPYYGLSFPRRTRAPEPSRIELVQGVLARAQARDFPELAVGLGEALWNADDARLEAIAESHEPSSPDATKTAVEQGSRRRGELGHYSGGMFHCAPEWYWGADRFYHLENRLIEQGARKGEDHPPVCPRPAIATGPLEDHGSLKLEFYPSLRSPYTSAVFDETVQFAKHVGIELAVKPVLPMVMRGVSLTRQKGMYIMSDAAREADARGLKWGKMYDPIGDPVRKAYSLYPWACQQGKGNELLSSFLHAAFFDGVNTSNDRGMRTVVENAGLSWTESKRHLGNRAWEDELEANRLAMYEFDAWGVPSYRLLDRQGDRVLGVWGQDRLWLVSHEIQRLLGDAR